MKDLNQLAGETLNKLLKLSDEEFFAYFSKFEKSDISDLMIDSGILSSAASEAECVYSENISYENGYVFDQSFLTNIEQYEKLLNELGIKPDFDSNFWYGLLASFINKFKTEKMASKKITSYTQAQQPMRSESQPVITVYGTQDIFTDAATVALADTNNWYQKAA